MAQPCVHHGLAGFDVEVDERVEGRHGPQRALWQVKNEFDLSVLSIVVWLLQRVSRYSCWVGAAGPLCACKL